MRRLVQMRRQVLSLLICVTLLGAAAGAALWHAFKPMLALSSPTLQTDTFQVDQLQVQYERFLESLWTFSAGQTDVAALTLRLDVLASRLAPARELSGITELPGPAGALRLLDRKIETWTPVVAGLRDGDAVSLARVKGLIEDVKGFRSQVQDMVVETSRSFSDQRDRERILFFARFRWLLMAIVALVLGLAVLVGFLWRQLKRSSQLGESLAELNLTLEERVARRTLQLQERERQLHTILDASPIAVALLRLEDQQTLFVNQRFRRQFDLQSARDDGALVGASLGFESIFESPQQAQDFWRFFHISRALEDYEVRLRRGPDGTQGWSLVSARELAVDGVPVLLFWAYDITTRKQLEAELRQLAHTDPLTGVLNRRAFDERSGEALAAARRQQRPLAVLMVDIDHFKPVNDTHGHAAGDAAIQQVAALALRNLRALDLLGRLGGEEFGILLPETTQTEALAMAERLRESIAAAPLDVGGVTLHLTVSIGVASMAQPGEGDDTEALFRRADEALYAAKRGGRNRVVMADEFSNSGR